MPAPLLILLVRRMFSSFGVIVEPGAVREPIESLGANVGENLGLNTTRMSFMPRVLFPRWSHPLPP
jgi:hypothetical protein